MLQDLLSSFADTSLRGLLHGDPPCLVAPKRLLCTATVSVCHFGPSLFPFAQVCFLAALTYGMHQTPGNRSFTW